jgi:hypothetical protein
VPPKTGAALAESRSLRDKIELLLPALLDAGDRLLGHQRIRELYPEYLAVTHGIIRASVPLMEAARGRAEEMADDPVAAALSSYLHEHIPEELDHDMWLLDDLEALGRDRSAVLEAPPSPTVAALVGAQYYWIFHYHPVALLGYIAVLEGYPPTAAMIDSLVARTGYERDGFQTLIAHGELDPHHREELDETLDSLPLTTEQSAAVSMSAMFTVHMLTRAIDEILEHPVPG